MALSVCFYGVKCGHNESEWSADNAGRGELGAPGDVVETRRGLACNLRLNGRPNQWRNQGFGINCLDAQYGCKTDSCTGKKQVDHGSEEGDNLSAVVFLSLGQGNIVGLYREEYRKESDIEDESNDTLQESQRGRGGVLVSPLSMIGRVYGIGKGLTTAMQVMSNV